MEEKMLYKAERKIIGGELDFTTGIHIGSGDEGVWIDSTIVKTKEGKPFIPDTTIAGIFRQLAEENFTQARVNDLFGCIKKPDGSRENCASRLIFCDAFLSGESQDRSGYRNGVGIKRDSLTSREGSLFSLETVEKPKFDFKLIIDNPKGSDMAIIKPILAEFQSGRVAIGADKSRGLGWVELYDLKVVNISPTDIDDFVDYLVDDIDIMNSPNLELNEVKTNGDKNHIEIKYNLALENEDASLIVSSGVEGFSANADQTLMKDKDDRFFIPGSSIKGPLRAQAERIVRHLKANFVCDPTDPDNSCSAGIKEVKKNNKKVTKEEIEENSCPICRIFGNGYLASKIFFADVYDKTEQITQIIENVAIDRFTGGGLDGAKFNTEVTTAVNLKGKIILKDVEKWEAGLIAFVMRDWIMGDIRIGFGKMKGYGRCKVDLEKITLCWQDENWLKDKNITAGKKRKSGFYNYAALKEESLELDKYKGIMEGLFTKLENEVRK